MSKTDGLGPRYKQPCGVGVHVDISTHRQEGVNPLADRKQPFLLNDTVVVMIQNDQDLFQKIIYKYHIIAHQLLLGYIESLRT